MKKAGAFLFLFLWVSFSGSAQESYLQMSLQGGLPMAFGQFRDLEFQEITLLNAPDFEEQVEGRLENKWTLGGEVSLIVNDRFGWTVQGRVMRFLMPLNYKRLALFDSSIFQSYDLVNADPLQVSHFSTGPVALYDLDFVEIHLSPMLGIVSLRDHTYSVVDTMNASPTFSIVTSGSLAFSLGVQVTPAFSLTDFLKLSIPISYSSAKIPQEVRVGDNMTTAEKLVEGEPIPFQVFQVGLGLVLKL
jgi:hypothetical protein